MGFAADGLARGHRVGIAVIAIVDATFWPLDAGQLAEAVGDRRVVVAEVEDLGATARRLAGPLGNATEGVVVEGGAGGQRVGRGGEPTGGVEHLRGYPGVAVGAARDVA